MSLDLLAELVSVTNNAVQSVNKARLICTTDTMQFFDVDSPFLSPRSLKSLSEKSQHTDDNLTSAQPVNSELKQSVISNSTDGVLTTDTKLDSIGKDRENIHIDIVPCENSNVLEHELQNLENYIENIDINGSQKVSLPKKQLKEIIFPRDLSNETSSSCQLKTSSKDTEYNPTNKAQTFPFASSKQFFVERHERRNETANTNYNREINAEDDAGSVGSGSKCHSQPEIIDVEGIAISSDISESSVDVAVGVQSKDKMSGEYGKTSSSNKMLIGENELHHGLKQGSLKNGFVDPLKTGFSNDVYISQFGLTERQKVLKEALIKRSENNKAKKKLVQPQIVKRMGFHVAHTEPLVTDKQSGSSAAVADPVITAAAAASAAVAAAQPFLKTQHELETQMQQLLTQLTELQQGKNVQSGKSSGADNRIIELERQVADMTERRFEHLEKLQQQQLQMQAQLLYMSQTRSQSNQSSHPGLPTSPARQSSRNPQAVGSHQGASSLKTNFISHKTSSQNQSASYHNNKKPVFNPATLSQHHNYLSEVRELQGFHLDTPAPRDKVPKPTPYTLLKEPSKNLGFLEELLSGKDADRDSTFNVKGNYSSPPRLRNNWNNSSLGRHDDHSPVNKARELVTSLSNLEKETADSVWDSRHGSTKTNKMNAIMGPAPLDQYLRYPEKEGSPYPKLSHHSKKSKKLLDTVDNLLEAKNILRHLEMTRETLEANLDQVVRSRRDMHVFSTLLGPGTDSPADDQLRIEKLVNKKISAMEGDVQREVLRCIAQAEAEKQIAQQQLELAVKQRRDQIKTGTKGQDMRNVRLAYSKANLLSTATLTSKGKENRESTIKPPPKTTFIKDEATRVRTYGKPEYQRGRTTIRDPYLHFKNPKKGVAAKSSITNLNESARSRDDRQRSPQSKHYEEPVIDPMPKQFYFSPTRGYIALGAGDLAPVQGQLVSMAIPLGVPRLEPGVRRSAAPVTKCFSDPVSSTPVTAARNVAMISFPVSDGKQQEHDRQPELAKQVLPPIDIDSISPSSQRSDIHMRSPQRDNANVTFLSNTQNIPEYSDLNKTLTEDNSVLEQSGEGIELPGYYSKTTKHSVPNFSPRFNKPGPEWAVSAGQSISAPSVSNVLAEDLRRRDLLENNAVILLEQELMARVLSQVPYPEPEQAINESRVESEEASDCNESLLVADVIGQDGMQLFINAGQPVSNALVQQLIKEVLQEKIMTLMAQRIAEGGTDQTNQLNVEEEIETEMIVAKLSRVQTPEPTPISSPISLPKKTILKFAQVVTPPQSPPEDGYRFKNVEPKPQVLPEAVNQQQVTQPPVILQLTESESETTLSLDISEELRRVVGKDNSRQLTDEPTVMCYDIATPPFTPPPPAEVKEFQFIPDRQNTPVFTPPPTVKSPSPPQTSLTRQKKAVIVHEEDEEMLEQPHPIMMSVSVGDSRPMTAEIQTQHRSPSPKRPLSPASISDDASTSSMKSSSSETTNEFISEGQWLMSYSEGQVLGPGNYDAIRKAIAGKGYQHIIDVSTASTLKDTEDLDLDVEGTKSEGEFIHGGVPDPDKDPRLEVLAELLRKPPHVNPILISQAPLNAMFNTGRSSGEMSIGQVPSSKLAMEPTRQNGQRGRSPSDSPHSSIDRSMGENRGPKLSKQERRNYNEKERMQEHLSRTSLPQKLERNQTPPPYAQQNRTPSPQQRSRTPPQHGQHSRTLSQQQGTSGPRPRAQIQYQPVLSEGRPLATRGKNMTVQRGSYRSNDSRNSHSSDPGMRRSSSIINSQSVSKSADSDAFRLSGNGFLTSSLKSRQSGVKKSVEFDLRTEFDRLEPRHSLEDVAAPNSSFGLTFTEASLDESELRKIGAGTTSNVNPYRMSVTIPSGADGEDSELSEIDIKGD